MQTLKSSSLSSLSVYLSLIHNEQLTTTQYVASLNKV